jgi:hypothetical protein
VTKNAPDRNLKTSFQILFIQAHSKHSYDKLALAKNSFCRRDYSVGTGADEMSALRSWILTATNRFVADAHRADESLSLSYQTTETSPPVA